MEGVCDATKIPTYVQNSALFETITFPFTCETHYLKQTISITTQRDLISLLSTLIYWNPFEIEQDIFDQILEKHSLFDKQELVKILGESILIDLFDTLIRFNKENNDDDIVVINTDINKYASKLFLKTVFQYFPRIDLLKYAIRYKYENSEYVLISIKNDDTECLKYCLDCGLDTDLEPEIDLVVYSIYKESLKCLKYLHHIEMIFPRNVYLLAIEKRNISILKYLVAISIYPLTNFVFKTSVRIGNLEIVKYLLEEKCPHHPEYIDIASYEGHLDCLKYLHLNKFPITKKTAIEAVRNGKLDNLRYILLNISDDICELYYVACQYGCLDSLICIDDFIIFSKIDRVKKIECCYISIENNNLPCLLYLQKEGWPVDSKVENFLKKI